MFVLLRLHLLLRDTIKKLVVTSWCTISSHRNIDFVSMYLSTKLKRNLVDQEVQYLDEIMFGVFVVGTCMGLHKKKLILTLKKEFVSTIHIFEDKSSIFQQSMLNRSVKRRKTEFQAKLGKNGTSGIKW